DHDERPRLQADLGDKGSMLLRNHGTLTLGATVAQAFTRMYFLERACAMQIATMSSGRELYPTADEVIDKNEAIGKGGLMMSADGLIWPALLRKLEREQPDYKN
ncbi:MAG: class II aldolase/adducin family protein, partial [Parvularculaceae bacterium]|nr:class II aldolase/adducin family protein [Parvularculaceae bacterium]